MYNNFSSKKTKKVISALLASALVVTSGPITADAATAKVVGIKKSITVSASATNKVTGLSKAEKKIVKVTKKGKKFTIKGLKAGKATFKIGKKSYTVKVGATTVKAAKTKLTLTKGKAATLKFTTKSGNGDTLTFKASNKNVTLAKKSAKIAKSAASVKATAKKAGKTTITATSKATGKKATVTVTVKNAAKPATTTPGASNTPVATATGSATNTPEATATATATATASGSATNTPDVTATPVATATATPVATGSATNTPEATEVPTEAPTKAPEVVTGGTITVTTNVSGASIKIISGTAVIATADTKATTGAAIKDIANGSYVLEVSKDDYETATKVVTVNGDVSVDIALAKIANIKIKSATAVNAIDGSRTELDGAKNVVGDKDRGINITFDRAIDETTANVNNFKILKDGVSQPLKSVKLSTDKKTVTIKTVSNLKDATTYTLVVAPEVQAEASTLTLGKQQSFSFTTGNFVYAESGITNTYVDLATDVELSKDSTVALTSANVTARDKIKVTYNQTIDPSTINTSTVKLYNVTDKKYVGVTASVDASTNDKQVVVKPAAALDGNKQYRLEITGLKALLGVDVMNESFEFVTNATASVASVKQPDGSNNLDSAKVYPKLTAGTIDDGNTIYFGAKFFVSFSGTQNIDASTINTDTITLVKWDKANNKVLDTIKTTVSYDANTRRASVTPLEDLEDGADFRLQVKGVKDEFGLSVVNGNGKDTTEAIFQTLDATAPTILGVELKEGATGTFKSVNSGVTGIDETAGTIYVKVKFSEAIANTSIVADNTSNLTTFANGKSVILVNAADGKTVSNLNTTVDFSTDKKEATFALTGLSNNATYTLLLSGKTNKPNGADPACKVITDKGVSVGGGDITNRLAETYSFSFSTKSADVTAPTIEGVKYGSSYKDGKTLNGATNLQSTNDDVYVQFSEKIALNGNPIELGKADGSAPYTQTVEAYGTSVSLRNNVTDENATLLDVNNVTSVAAGDIIEISEGSTTKYAIVKVATDNGSNDTITLVSKIGAEFTTDATVKVLKGVTVSDAATDAKTLKIDLATANAKSGVETDTQLKLTVKNTVTDVAGNALTSASYTFLTGSAAGTTEVVNKVEVDKTAGQFGELPTTNVLKGTNIKVTFGEAYAKTSVDANTIKVMKADGTVVDCKIDATTNANYVTLDPTADLEEGAEYTVTVDGVKDLAGNAIAKYSKSFVVKSAPTFKSCSIADGEKNVDVTPVIEVKIANGTLGTSGVDYTSNDSHNDIQLQKADGTFVPVYYMVSNNTVKLYPTNVLDAYKEYKVVVGVGTGISSEKTIKFTTSSEAQTAGVESATYDSANKAITVQFNVPVKGVLYNSETDLSKAASVTTGTGSFGSGYNVTLSTTDPTKMIITLGSSGANIIPGTTFIDIVSAITVESGYAAVAAYTASTDDEALNTIASTHVVVK